MHAFRFGLFVVASLIVAATACAESLRDVQPLLRKYCFDCHGDDESQANVNLQELTANVDLGRRFKQWEKAAEVLTERRMPPEDSAQPSDKERQRIVASIRESLDAFVKKNAGDPGQVALRRLTSAEYEYTIEDLTGLRLDLARTFVSDGVGGEGFTNIGEAQFVQEATLERYLEAAKLVSSHAVIGAGPLTFYADPGRTGQELSAITRIQAIYREHGFRTRAGEGAEPFGLDRYPQALFAAWQFRHRDKLGLGSRTLSDLAASAEVDARFLEHIWHTVNRDDATFPTSLIVSRWRELPAPRDASADELAAVRSGCDELYAEMRRWQSVLGATSDDEEEAAVLTEDAVHIQSRHRRFRADIRWPKQAIRATADLVVESASLDPSPNALVVWRDASIRFRTEDGRRTKRRPLVDFLTADTVERLRLGRHPRGGNIGEGDFVLPSGSTTSIRFRTRSNQRAAEIYVDVQLDLKHGEDGILRCSISDGAVEGETAAETGASAVLLGDPQGKRFAAWRTGVVEFARQLPEVSHREPAPSDRDPIPAPYDNTYNTAERNLFHTAVKYHRDDRFFVEHIADDATRQRLDQAWNDLLTAFDFYDVNLRFAAKKYSLDLDDRGIADLDDEWIAALPDGPRSFVHHWRDEYHARQNALRAAEPGHVDDLLSFAERAWRRTLSSNEQQGLRDFYSELRSGAKLDHVSAVRAVLARILVAPAFLYRSEPSRESTGIVALSDAELASRLGFFLWSAGPDQRLREAAAADELSEDMALVTHARQMLRDPRARRLSAEFFGQWLGFYRFDEYRGVDAERFPEFTDALKSAMHDEAVSFFEHIIREDRPIDEILFADYTFVNEQLAKHYGIDQKTLSTGGLRRVAGLSKGRRGGLLGMGAVLTMTSAPLRTSAVRRGDWVLRRVIGTPVPPPPADAGSIPADDVLADGLTSRQRLEAHRAKAACVNCHSRIDPLGFALENFDAIGRWRVTYRDGQAIDSASKLADGTVVSGPDGLRDYLTSQRKPFHRTLSTKLLGYALGRAELASDRPLLDAMVAELGSGGSLADIVELIVTSKQFRYRRAN